MQSGGAVLLVTLTVRHGRYDRLADLMSGVADGFRSVLSGRAWVEARQAHGVVGTIRALEVTVGENGWHPHLHALLLLEPALMHDVDGVREYVERRWIDHLRSVGLDALPGVAVDVRRADSADVGAYVAKVQDPARVGNELARLDMKRGRTASSTPFEALERVTRSGDIADLVLWWEYERASKGRQCITWSKGLKTLLGVNEVSDSEILDDVDAGDLVLWLDAATWARLVTERLGTCGLLEAAERDGLDGATAYLAARGLRWELPGHDPP